MTHKQKEAGREFLLDLQFDKKVPDFHIRIRKDGDLRTQAATGIMAAVSRFVRNPDELGEEKRYGITKEEAEVVVDDFVREMGG